MALLTVFLFGLLLVFGGCGSDSGDTTIIHKTTTVTTEPDDAASGEQAATTPEASDRPTEEFTGRCTGQGPPLVPEPGKPGFTDVRVVEAPCDYANQVATEFVSAYGPDCFDGCSKMIESIPCRTTGPAHADVVCAAARTEVRFSIQGSD